MTGQPRVALLVDQFPELSETFIAAEARTLAELGHAVRVESKAHAPEPNADAARGLDVAYRADDGRARRLADMLWLVARRPRGVLRDLLDRRRWRREEHVPPLRQLAPVARRIARFRAAHLHAHFAAGAALDALRIGALLELPYSVMTHGYDIFSLPRNLREKHERAAFAVSACDYSARFLAERHGIGGVRRIVMGVDGELFRRRAPYTESRTVLAVGRLVEKKGFEHLIRAVQRGGAVERLVIVGEGPLRDRLDVGGVVELAGARTPAQIRELLERSALVAVPSVEAADGDRDTMPVIAKEALAMEVPVVASDAFGLPELVRPDWGRLVPPGDEQALAAAIDELLALPLERRAEMGRAGREFVLRECSLRGETERLAQMIATARTSGS